MHWTESCTVGQKDLLESVQDLLKIVAFACRSLPYKMPTAFVAVNAGINIIIAAVGIALNALIIFAFCRIKSLRTVNNTFLCELAAADFIKSIMILCVKVHNQLNDKKGVPKFYCQLSGVIITMTTLMSVLLLAAIGIGRYFKIVRWRSFEKLFSRRRMMLYCGGIVVAAFVPTLLPLSGLGKFTFSKFHGVCFATWAKGNVPFRSLFYVYTIGFSFPILIFCYARIFAKLRKHSRAMQARAKSGRPAEEFSDGATSEAEGKVSSTGQASTGYQNNDVSKEKADRSTSNDSTIDLVPSVTETKFTEGSKSAETNANNGDHINQTMSDNPCKKMINQDEKRAKRKRFSEREIQVTKVMFTVVIAYAVCWFPAFLITVVTLSGLAKPSPNAFHVIVTCVELKILLNPLIYGLWNPQFRNAFKSLFFSRSSAQNTSTANEANNSRTSNSNVC